MGVSAHCAALTANSAPLTLTRQSGEKRHMPPVQSGSPICAPAAHSPNPDAGPYLLTLCRLESGAPVRPPRAPQLERFRFFSTRAKQSDGTERRYLHMGYFPSLAEAQKWAQLMRRTYPNAIATLAPATLLRHPDSGVPTLTPPAQPSSPPAKPAHPPAPLETKTLTDTQVLGLLETRRTLAAGESGAEVAGIPLLRPEDAEARRVIKEAVVQGAPVCFAVQLLWSIQPIDLGSVPSVSIFRAYSLYVMEGQREGHTWYCLRLGFFGDTLSAKQVAYFVRSSFASVAVVPVTERERALAKESPVPPASLADPFRQSLDQALAADQRRAPQDSAPAADQRRAPQGSAPAAVAAGPVANRSAPDQRSSPPKSPPPATDRSPGAARAGSDTLAQTLEMLATSELWENEESMSETGVRHLAVQVQKTKTRRS